MSDATRNGVPYVPQIGADGAGATYVANEAAIAQALAGAPADFSTRWDALGPSNSRTTSPSQSNSSASPGAAPGNPAAPPSPSGSDAPLGIVSGKPMRFFGAPIFDTRRPSTALDDLIWNSGRLRASPSDAGAAAPLAPALQNSFDPQGGPSSPATSAGNAFPSSPSQNPQGPLSLNDAYLEYLKRLNAAQAQ